jgi:hypothetical protein
MAEVINGESPRKQLYRLLLNDKTPGVADKIKRYSFSQFENNLLNNENAQKELGWYLESKKIVSDPVDFSERYLQIEAPKPAPAPKAAPVAPFQQPVEPMAMEGVPVGIAAPKPTKAPAPSVTDYAREMAFEPQIEAPVKPIGVMAPQPIQEPIPSVTETAREMAFQPPAAPKKPKEKERGFMEWTGDVFGTISAGGERIAKNILAGIGHYAQAQAATDPMASLSYEKRQQMLQEAGQTMYDIADAAQKDFQNEVAKRNIETSVLQAIDKKQYKNIPEAVLYTVGDAAMQIIPSVLTMGGSTYLQTLPTAYKDGVEAIAKEKGISPEQVIASGEDAMVVASISSGFQSALENVGAGQVSKAIASKGAYKAVRDWLLKQNVNKNLARGAALLGVGIGEGTTEYFQEGVGQAGVIAAKSPTTKAFFERLPKELFTAEAEKQRQESFVGGLIGGGGLAGAGRAITKALEKPAKQPSITPEAEVAPEAPIVPPVATPAAPEVIPAQEDEDLAALNEQIAAIEGAPVEEEVVAEEAPAASVAPLNIDFSKNEGRNVNYQGVQGRIKIDSDGVPYVFTKDGDVVYIEGGLSGQTPQQLGVQPLADDVISETDIEAVLQDEGAPLDQGQLEYDFENNSITLYGKPFTYDGVEVNSKGQTTALRLKDANGKTKYVRNEDTILEFEIQKELYEKSKSNKPLTVESAIQAAEQLQVSPVARPKQVPRPVQQERPVGDIAEYEVGPVEEEIFTVNPETELFQTIIDNGEPVVSRYDAEKRIGDGERLFGYNEQDEGLVELSLSNLDAFPIDTIIAVRPEAIEAAPVEEAPVAAEEELVAAVPAAPAPKVEKPQPKKEGVELNKENKILLNGKEIGEVEGLYKVIDNEYQISGIKINDKSLRGKGYGKEAYRQLIKKLQEEGKILISDDSALSKDAKNIWESLVKSREAKKTNTGYESISISKTKAEPISGKSAKEMSLDELKAESSLFDEKIKAEKERLNKIAPNRQVLGGADIDNLSPEDAARSVEVNDEIGRRERVSQEEAKKRVAEKREQRRKEQEAPKRKQIDRKSVESALGDAKEEYRKSKEAFDKKRAELDKSTKEDVTDIFGARKAQEKSGGLFEMPRISPEQREKAIQPFRDRMNNAKEEVNRLTKMLEEGEEAGKEIEFKKEIDETKQLPRSRSEVREEEGGRVPEKGVPPSKPKKAKAVRKPGLIAQAKIIETQNPEILAIQGLISLGRLHPKVIEKIFGGGRSKNIQGERKARIGYLDKKSPHISTDGIAEKVAVFMAEALNMDVADVNERYNVRDYVEEAIKKHNSYASMAKEVIELDAQDRNAGIDEDAAYGEYLRQQEEQAAILGAEYNQDVADEVWDAAFNQMTEDDWKALDQMRIMDYLAQMDEVEVKAEETKPLEEDYFNGDKIAYTNEDAPKGFRTFIYLDGIKAGETGLVRTKEAQAEDVKKKQEEFREQQEGFKRIRESGLSSQMPKSPETKPAEERKKERETKEVISQPTKPKGEGATILPSIDADKAEAQLYISQKRNYYTLWYKRRRVNTTRGKEEYTYSYNYLTILSQNLEDARTKALDYLNSIASGESLSVAFEGKNIQDLRGAKTIALQEKVISPETETIVKSKSPDIKTNFGIGKYSGITIDELLDKDIDYAEWFVNNYTSRGADKTKAIIKGDPRYQEYLTIKRDIQDLERARIEAYEKREAERKEGKQVPVATLVRGEGGKIKEVVEETEVAKKKVEKKERRLVKDQITDIIPPQTKADDKVDDGLKPQMFKAQIDGANTAIASMDKNGVLLNGDGAGVGKTRQIIAVAKYYADKGKPVVIISENAAIGKPWESGKQPMLGGSMAKDSEAMGVNLTLLTDDKKVQSGGIYVSTYNRIQDADVPSGAIVIFDESQNLVNTFGRTPGGDVQEERQWEAKFRPMLKKAGAVAYYSATPADKPHQLAYLYKVLGFNSPEDFLSEMMNNGAIIKTKKYGKQEVKYYDVPAGRTQRARLYNWVNSLMVKAGQEGRFVKREISYEGTDVQFHDVKGTDEGRNEYAKEFNKVLDDLNDAEMMEYRLLAPSSYILYAAELSKIGEAVGIVKKQLAQGRKSIIFVSRINPMEIRGRRQQMAGEFGAPEVIGEIPSPVPMLEEALKKEGISFVGLHSKAKTTSQKAQKAFSEDADVLIASLESGGTGINLDDTIGDNPRTEVFLFSPYRGISTIQGMGRIWRASTIQNDNNPNRYVFVTASDISPDLNRSSVLAKKLQLMNAAIGGTAVSKLPMSKVSYDKEQLVGIELPDDTDEESSIFKEKTGILRPVVIDWKQSRKGGYFAKATADILEWMERGGPERTGLDIRVFKSEDGEWIALAGKNYKAEEFAPDNIPNEVAPAETESSFTSNQESSASEEFDGTKKPSKIKTKSFDNKYGKGAFERMQNITQNFEDIMDGLSEKIKQDCL